MNEVSIDQGKEIVKNHSKLGIASFVIFIVAILIEIIGVSYSTYLQVKLGNVDPKSMETIITGSFILFGIFLNIIGFALGVVGIFKKNTKKVFSIIGTILNVCIPLFLLLMIAIGLFAKSKGLV